MVLGYILKRVKPDSVPIIFLDHEPEPDLSKIYRLDAFKLIIRQCTFIINSSFIVSLLSSATCRRAYRPYCNI